MEIFDPYPIETKWRDSLPGNSTLHLLMYGLMSEFIEPLVKKYRLRDRNAKITKLIMGTTQHRLTDMVNELKMSLSGIIPIIRCRFWRGSGMYSTKKKKIEWYIKSGLSIQYIQSVYDKFKDGPPIFTKGDRLLTTLDHLPYVVISSGKRRIRCHEIEYRAIITKINWHKFTERSIYNIPHPNSSPVSIYVDPWKVTKVGEDTPECSKIRDKFVEDYNTEFYRRRLFWIHHLERADVDICHKTWYRQSIDVWNLTKVPYITYSDMYNVFWNNAWIKILSIVKSLK